MTLCLPSYTAGVAMSPAPSTFLSTAPALCPVYTHSGPSSKLKVDTAQRWPKLARSLVVVANMSHVAFEFERVLLRAKEMHAHNAYLHWYKRHGCEDADFMDAVETVEQVVGSYRGMMPRGYM